MASSALCASASPGSNAAVLGRSAASLLSQRHRVGNAADTQPCILHIPSLSSLQACKQGLPHWSSSLSTQAAAFGCCLFF